MGGYESLIKVVNQLNSHDGSRLPSVIMHSIYYMMRQITNRGGVAPQVPEFTQAQFNAVRTRWTAVVNAWIGDEDERAVFREKLIERGPLSLNALR